MRQARTAGLCHARTWETRMLNKLFFDPAVCEKTAMRLDMNLWKNQTKPNQKPTYPLFLAREAVCIIFNMQVLKKFKKFKSSRKSSLGSKFYVSPPSTQATQPKTSPPLKAFLTHVPIKKYYLPLRKKPCPCAVSTLFYTHCLYLPPLRSSLPASNRASGWHTRSRPTALRDINEKFAFL